MVSFCPKCGTEKGPFVRGFCTRCFLEDNRLLRIDRKLILPKCKRCGKILVRGRWLEENADSLLKFILSKVKWSDVERPSLAIEAEHTGKGLKIYLNVSCKVEGVPLSTSYETFIQYKLQYCESCLKISSSYYEATIQLRAEDKAKIKRAIYLIKDVLASQLKNDTLAEIVKMIKRKNGYDLLIGSKKAAKSAVAELKRKYKADVKKSSTLAGLTKDGKPKVKYTYSVRI